MPYNKAVDWWSLGILMVELLTGKPPFYNKNAKVTFRSILTEQPRIHPDIQLSELCKDFINKVRIGFMFLTFSFSTKTQKNESEA